jgi:2-dehydropantoate 2-reductase
LSIKIAILGAGAMGSLFGGFLSQKNHVWLIDTNQERVNKINEAGVTVLTQGRTEVFHPQAVCDSSGLEPVDVLLVFVKAIHSRAALSANKHLIGEHTFVMTLQNGAGHEVVLSEFAPPERVIIGTTEHNSSLTPEGAVHHGGGGKTYIGLLKGENERLQQVADSFSACGIETLVADNVPERIWRKLFVNASASVLTGVLGVKLGYILDNAHAWQVARRLIEEAVAVANAEGMQFAVEEIAGDVQDLLRRVYHGYTSIYADLQAGRLTEVDTINGTVVRKAKELGVPVPTHEVIVHLVHALEGKRDRQ